jgi:two-component system, OmpR family, response regulator ChvI
VGQYRTYRTIYDRLHYVGFIAGSGNDGYRANVRTVIKRIRNKFRALDPAFDEIESYSGFGYCWRKPATDRTALVPTGRSALAPPQCGRGRA